MRSLALPAAVLGLAMACAPALAQTDPMSAGDMTDRFAAQVLDGQKTRSVLGTGCTRGLAIAPACGDDAIAAESETGTRVAYLPVAPEAQVDVMIRFDYDSAILRPDQEDALVAICNAIRNSDIPKFLIVGHTDGAGSAAYNEHLSLLRAGEVKRHLVSDCAIPDDRLQAMGVGSQYLARPDAPLDEANRRVEFQVAG